MRLGGYWCDRDVVAEVFESADVVVSCSVDESMHATSGALCHGELTLPENPAPDQSAPVEPPGLNRKLLPPRSSATRRAALPTTGVRIRQLE